MEESKLNLFDFSDKLTPNAYKFYGGISNTSEKDLQAVKDYLYLQGIEIKLPSQMKVCTFSLETIKKRIEIAKSNDMMSKIVIDPVYLMNSNNFKSEEHKTIETNSNSDRLANVLKAAMLNLNLDVDTNYPFLNERLRELISDKYLDNHSEQELIKQTLIEGREYPDEVITEVENAINKAINEVN